MKLEQLQELEARWLLPTYRRAPVEFVRGEGARLWDSDGREYLDFLAGISVCSVGHCNPEVVEAVREQAGRLIHTSNLFYTEPMVRLAERLSESSLGGRVFFANSGTEANECAIKVARKHAHGRGVTEPAIVSFERDFHGRTYGSLSATPAMAADPALGATAPTGTLISNAIGPSVGAAYCQRLTACTAARPMASTASRRAAGDA